MGYPNSKYVEKHFNLCNQMLSKNQTGETILKGHIKGEKVTKHWKVHQHKRMWTECVHVHFASCPFTSNASVTLIYIDNINIDLAAMHVLLQYTTIHQRQIQRKEGI